MHLIAELFAFLWKLVREALGFFVGPFTRAISVRRVDDGTGP